MLLISIFHLYQPIDDDILVFFGPVLFSQTVSTFSDDRLLLQFLVLTDDVSGYLRYPRYTSKRPAALFRDVSSLKA